MKKFIIVSVASLCLVSACASADDDEGAADTTAPSATTTAPATTESTDEPSTVPSTDETSTDSTTATTEPPTTMSVVEDLRAPGVTDDTIKVGVTYVDLGVLKDVLKIDHGDYEGAYRAMFDDINARGGINGRMLEPIIVAVDPVTQTSSDEACTKLTQDDPVFVAVGFFLAANVLCFVNTNETPVIGPAQNSDLLSQAVAPWYATDAGEDLATDFLSKLAADGLLDGKVAVVGMATDNEAMEGVIKPLLDEAGVDTTTALIDADITDTAAIYSAAEIIAQRFEADGAEKVIVLNDAATAFGAGLSRTAYRPQLIYTSKDAALTYADSQEVDTSVLPGSIAAGLYGPADDQLTLPGVTQECLAVQHAAGLDTPLPSTLEEGAPTQAVSSLTACRQVTLLEAILTKAGPDLNFGTFRAAGDSLGEIELPGYPEPWTYGPPPQADGDPVPHIFQWDEAAGDYLRVDS